MQRERQGASAVTIAYAYFTQESVGKPAQNTDWSTGSAFRSAFDLAINAVRLEIVAQAVGRRAVACNGLKAVNRANINHTFLDAIAKARERIGAAGQFAPALFCA